MDKKNAGIAVKGIALVVALAFILSMVAYVAPFFTSDQSQTPAPGGGVVDQRTEQRAEQLRLALAKNPKDVATATELGDLYYDAGAQYGQSGDASKAAGYFVLATQAYSKVLKLRPGDNNVRTDMATAFYYSGNAARAIKELRTVLAADPKHLNALFNVGLISQQIGDNATAKSAWSAYLKIDSTSQKAVKVKEELQKIK